jgi:dCMP deaminase
MPQSSSTLREADALTEINGAEGVESALAIRRIDIPEYVEGWDQYFLFMAMVVSIKSKDPRCRVGAVITSSDHVVLSTGFNGLPRGVYDDHDILANVEEKLKVICHAEQNAILNAARIGVALKGAAIFVTKFPCLTCCNAIVQAGITRIYTHDSWFWDDDPFDNDHSRKKKTLKQAEIRVDAPFHPTYRPTEQVSPNKKKPPVRSKN